MLGEHVLTLGSDLLHDYLTTYQFLDNTSHEQNNIDAFAQFDFNPSRRINVVGSVRYDYFSASDAQAFTTRLAAVYKLDGITFRANYASGFRAPSLKEMYMHYDMGNMGYMIIGNPDVKPEKSNNFNIAIEHNGKVQGCGFLNGKYSIMLMGYCNIFDKRITSISRYWVVDNSYKEGGYQVLYDDNRISEEGDGYVFTADNGTRYEALTSSLYWNEDGITVRGLDLSAQYRLDFGLSLRYNYAYMHESGNVVYSRFSQPRSHSMTWRIDYDHRFSRKYAIGIGLSGRYLGKPQSGSKDVDQGYTLWKLMLQQHILKGIHVNLAIDNILNYKPKAYYYCSPMTTGTTYSLGISVDL
jgi:outer membrane receptor for ferrienterochelin and colicins